MRILSIMAAVICIMIGTIGTAGATAEGTGIAEGLNYSIDDFHNRTIYFGKFDVASVALYPMVYVDNTTGKATMILHANCDGNTGNWQCYDKIYIQTDKNLYTIDCQPEQTHYYVGDGMTLCETYQTVVDDKLLVMLKDMVASDKVQYRFSGKYVKSRDLSGAKKERLGKLINLYEHYNGIKS